MRIAPVHDTLLSKAGSSWCGLIYALGQVKTWKDITTA